MTELLKWLFLLPIAACALLVAKLISAWSQLPDRVTVHFGIRGQPNQWASKSAFAGIIAIVSGMLAFSSLMLNSFLPSPLPIMIVAISSLTVVTAFWQAIDFNTTGKPLRIGIILIPEILLLLVFLYFFAINKH